MPGGLLQIVATGAQDAHLSANPQITFWKMLYKRHTNFAMEAFRINFNGQPNWGTKQTAIVGRHADLLFKTYVEVQLPYYDNTPSSTTPASWNNDQGRLGYNLIDYVELDIGGQIIDRQYSEFMYLWDALTFDANTSTKAWNMVGANVPAGSQALANTNGCVQNVGRPTKPNTLYIPLYFFFTRNAGAALPLIALQYHEVKINVQWNETKVIAGNFNNASKIPNPKSAAIYIDYIYLDVDERRRFAQQTHEYLIEQSQFNEDQEIASASVRLDLTFNHPIKELIWVVQPHSYTNCNASKLAGQSRLQPFTYDQSPVYEQYLQFNGQDRMDRRYGDYFNKVQMYQHHTGVGGTVSSSALPQTQPGIYCYSFALKPEEHQPSGTCNFSRIDTATLVMSLDGGVAVDDNTHTWDARVYAINYNVLRIMSGMCGLSYSN